MPHFLKPVRTTKQVTAHTLSASLSSVRHSQGTRTFRRRSPPNDAQETELIRSATSVGALIWIAWSPSSSTCSALDDNASQYAWSLTSD